MNMTIQTLLLIGFVGCSFSCIRPAEHRSEDERNVGVASVGQSRIEVQNGQAAVRAFSETEALLWAQAPVFSLTLSLPTQSIYTLDVKNCMPNAAIQFENSTVVPQKISATHCRFTLALPPGETKLSLAPPDWDELTPFKFADMGDIQTAMDSVHEVFQAISQTPNLRFVLCTGDITERGQATEYDLFETQLEHLNIPLYSTIGNHELMGDISQWHHRYGRYSLHFDFKGVAFTYLDSGNATFDSLQYEQLARWLEKHKNDIHIFGTHYPAIDPIGSRRGGFRSGKEAFKLLKPISSGKN